MCHSPDRSDVAQELRASRFNLMTFASASLDPFELTGWQLSLHQQKNEYRLSSTHIETAWTCLREKCKEMKMTWGDKVGKIQIRDGHLGHSSEVGQNVTSPP